MTRWIVLHGTHDVTAGAQRRLQVDRPRLLPRGRDRDQQQVLFQPRNLRARRGRQRTEPAQGPGHSRRQSGDAARREVSLPSDSDHPSVFWITNGWNDFIGNMAAGAGACGSCYWLVPVINSDRPDVPTADNVQDRTHMKWSGYAALQNNLRGTMPLKSFYRTTPPPP